MKKSSAKFNIYSILVISVVGVLLTGGLIWWQKSNTKPSTPISVTESTSPQSETIGIILRSPSSQQLSPLQPVDQNKYAQAIQAAWSETLAKAPQNVAKFSNDPNLIAFQLMLPNQAQPQSFVVYGNRPVIVETNPVDSLPDNQAYQLDFDRENYQLVIKFTYTPQVTALDLNQVLTETFNQILNYRRPSADQENNPYKILAFEALI